MSEKSAVSEAAEITLDSQLCFALYSASNTIDQYYRPLLEEHDLTYAQYIVLMALAEKDNVSITSLANRLGLSKATMTPLLRRLEGRNLLRREMAEGDERQKFIHLTPEGRELWSESCKVTDKVFEKTKLTPDEAATLVALCKRITRS